MDSTPVLVSSTQSGKEPVSSGNAVRLEDMTSEMRRCRSPVETSAAGTSVPERLAAGVSFSPGAKMISTTTRTIMPMRNGSVPLRGFARRSMRRFFLGGLEWIIRLERMGDFLSKFDKIAGLIIA